MTNINSYITLIKRLNTLIENHINHEIQEHDITMSQGALMFQLINAPDETMTLKQAEKFMKLSQPVTAGIVKRLEEKEYLYSFNDENDKRIKIIKATELGKNKLLEARKIMLSKESEILDGLSEEDIDQLGQYLIHIKNNIENKWR